MEAVIAIGYLAAGAWFVGRLVRRHPGRFDLQDNVSMFVLVGVAFVWPVFAVLYAVSWGIVWAARRREP